MIVGFRMLLCLEIKTYTELQLTIETYKLHYVIAASQVNS